MWLSQKKINFIRNSGAVLGYSRNVSSSLVGTNRNLNRHIVEKHEIGRRTDETGNLFCYCSIQDIPSSSLLFCSSDAPLQKNFTTRANILDTHYMQGSYGRRFYSLGRVIQSANLELERTDAFEFRTQPAAQIKKILISNRGEIACRIIRTAKKLGILTVAVYSEADRLAKHVKEADEAVLIGTAPSDQSYLNKQRILEAVENTGAQAVHPGYGFLSENSSFAQLCKDSNVEFIGPPPSAIQSMGDKSESKSLMIQAGVPVVPGYHGECQDFEVLLDAANKIGFPVLIKATQGGGGKGMRIVNKKEEFSDLLESAKREAMSAFGNERVLIEKYISQPRHIEVQIFGDKHGNCVHLYERDCSIQRRHQKVIEEAPAPFISEEFRRKIGEAAVNAAKAVGYVSAGTVEFIVDSKTGEFFFMEMNTRLQVEHPITEMITGQDLVEWQIRIANGETIPMKQNEISIHGHAFEARIYAENVSRGFLPASGTLHFCRHPLESPSVRIETGVREGDTVSVFYDPMVAKLVVWGKNRNAALTKLQSALQEYKIAGVPTNLGFLQLLASHSAFLRGELDTHFIEKHKDDVLPHSEGGVRPSPESSEAYTTAMAVAAASYCSQERWKSKRSRKSGLPAVWRSGSGFRINHLHSKTLNLTPHDESGEAARVSWPVTVEYCRDGSFSVKVPQKESIQVTVEALDGQDCSNLRIMAGDVKTSATVTSYAQGENEHLHLWLNGSHFQFKLPLAVDPIMTSEAMAASTGGSHGASVTGFQGIGAVLTPMAGRVTRTFCCNGDIVKKGDVILVLEAMKMEHTVKAPVDGKVTDFSLKQGQQVQDGSILCRIVAKDLPPDLPAH